MCRGTISATRLKYSNQLKYGKISSKFSFHLRVILLTGQISLLDVADLVIVLKHSCFSKALLPVFQLYYKKTTMIPDWFRFVYQASHFVSNYWNKGALSSKTWRVMIHLRIVAFSQDLLGCLWSIGKNFVVVIFWRLRSGRKMFVLSE